jgi:pyrrolysyl-tRNA synthetase-like protein
MPLVEKALKKVYYRKQIPLFRLVQKMKLWPSRRGLLHGVQYFEIKGDYGEIITHCNKRMIVRDSKNSRSARWLRNKWFLRTCPECGVPEWKLEKYKSTFFRRRWGSQLLQKEEE